MGNVVWKLLGSGSAILAGIAAAWLPWFTYQERTIFTFYAVVFAPYVILAVTYCLGLILGPAHASLKRRRIGAGLVGAYVVLAVGVHLEGHANMRSARRQRRDTAQRKARQRAAVLHQFALALHHLVSTRFRQDRLQLISFGRFAQTRTIESLLSLDAQYEAGTNLHHALLLAGRFFREHPTMQPVLLIVTDGEPTAHLLSGGVKRPNDVCPKLCRHAGVLSA